MNKIYYIEEEDGKITTTLEKKMALKIGCELQKKKGWQWIAIAAWLFNTGTIVYIFQAPLGRYWWNWMIDIQTFACLGYGVYCLFSAWDAKRFKP